MIVNGAGGVRERQDDRRAAGPDPARPWRVAVRQSETFRDDECHLSAGPDLYSDCYNRAPFRGPESGEAHEDTCLCGRNCRAAERGLAAQQAAQPRSGQTPAVSPRPAVSHGAAPPLGPLHRRLARFSESAGRSYARRATATRQGRRSVAGRFRCREGEQHADVAEKMIRKLRAGMMPPPGAKRPDAATIKALVDALETRIDAAAALNPNPGWRPFQRLNRAEYAARRARPARPRRRRRPRSCRPTRSATGSTTSPTCRASRRR